jgi:hypothetical protein
MDGLNSFHHADADNSRIDDGLITDCRMDTHALINPSS